MAAMLTCEAGAIDEDRRAAACHAARIFGAVVMLKASTTPVAAPDGSTFLYTGGSVELATGSPGDVRQD